MAAAMVVLDMLQDVQLLVIVNPLKHVLLITAEIVHVIQDMELALL